MLILLQKLYTEGITLKMNGNREVTIRFQVIFIQGDNLGLHDILGFIERFSGIFFWRFCKIHKSEAKRLYIQNVVNVRNKESYEK